MVAAQAGRALMTNLDEELCNGMTNQASGLDEDWQPNHRNLLRLPRGDVGASTSLIRVKGSERQGRRREEETTSRDTNHSSEALACINSPQAYKRRDDTSFFSRRLETLRCLPLSSSPGYSTAATGTTEWPKQRRGGARLNQQARDPRWAKEVGAAQSQSVGRSSASLAGGCHSPTCARF